MHAVLVCNRPTTTLLGYWKHKRMMHASNFIRSIVGRLAAGIAIWWWFLLLWLVVLLLVLVCFLVAVRTLVVPHWLVALYGCSSVHRGLNIGAKMVVVWMCK